MREQGRMDVDDKCKLAEAGHRAHLRAPRLEPSPGESNPFAPAMYIYTYKCTYSYIYIPCVLPRIPLPGSFTLTSAAASAESVESRPGTCSKGDREYEC